MHKNGLPYDDLFCLVDRSEVSCVEMCRIALQAEPNYAENFAELEKAIAKYKNLTPQMYRDCSDFEVVYEAKR